MKKICPECCSLNTKKNGHVRSTGKQNNYCKDCGRNFSDSANKKYISKSTKEQVRRALLERASLRGICRIFSISLKWLVSFFIKETNKLPEDLNFNQDLAEKIHLEQLDDDTVIFCEADELCTYVGNKKKKVWLWIALDCETLQILAFHVGDRSKKSCKKLWDKIPISYKKKLYMFTDHLKSYKSVIPKSQHKDVDKGSGLTSLIESFNNVLRQRLARLVRKTASFSKSEANLVRTVHLFLVEYNLHRQLKFE